MCVSVTHVQLFGTPWTAAHQSSLSMRLCRQGYWSGLPFPPPEDLSNSRTEPESPALKVDSLLSESPFLVTEKIPGLLDTPRFEAKLAI